MEVFGWVSAAIAVLSSVFAVLAVRRARREVDLAKAVELVDIQTGSEQRIDDDVAVLWLVFFERLDIAAIALRRTCVEHDRVGRDQTWQLVRLDERGTRPQGAAISQGSDNGFARASDDPIRQSQRAGVARLARIGNRRWHRRHRSAIRPGSASRPARIRCPVRVDMRRSRRAR